MPVRAVQVQKPQPSDQPSLALLYPWRSSKRSDTARSSLTSRYVMTYKASKWFRGVGGGVQGVVWGDARACRMADGWPKGMQEPAVVPRLGALFALGRRCKL